MQPTDPQSKPIRRQHRTPAMVSAVLLGAVMGVIGCGSSKSESGPNDFKFLALVELDEPALAGQQIMRYIDDAERLGTLRVATFTRWPPFATTGGRAEFHSAFGYRISMGTSALVELSEMPRKRTWVYASFSPDGAPNQPRAAITIGPVGVDQVISFGTCKCDNQDESPDKCQRTCSRYGRDQGIPSVDPTRPDFDATEPVIVRLNKDLN